MNAFLVRTPFRCLRGFLILATVLALLALLLPAARAQLYTESTTLPRGWAYVSISGDTFVSAGEGFIPQHQDVQTYSSSIYVRTASGWTLQQDVTYHGGDVTLDGDTLVIGDAIYFRSNGVWTKQASLGYDDRMNNALQGDTAVMAFPSDRAQAWGFITVFFRTGTTWTEQGRFGPPTGDLQQMGSSVALDRDTIIAGTEGRNGIDNFGAHVFVRNAGAWTYQATLTIPGAGYRMDVAIEGDTAAVSDPQNGRVAIFNRAGTTWTLAQVLSSTAGSSLGYRVVMRGGVLAVKTAEGFSFFTRDSSGWVLVQTIAGPNSVDMALGEGGKEFVTGAVGSSSGFTDSQLYSTPPPPVPGSGWRDYDVGAVGAAGNSSDDGTTVTVRGSGADIWDRGDQFHFRSESLTGDGAIIARVTSAGTSHPWAKVGLMFREDIAPAARNFMALVTPGAHLGTQVRAATANTTAFQDAGWAGAPIWLMLARSGNLFASYRSDDGNHWTPIGSATVDMPATLHVGLAVSSHDNTSLDTATFSNIEIVGLPPPPNDPPVAPSNLQAGNQTSTTVNLGWTDNSGDETGFDIQRSAGDGSGEFSTVATAAANATSYVDSGLTPDTQYTYRVRAVRAQMYSANSNTFTIRTLAGSSSGANSADIGNVGVAGATNASGDAVTLNAGGEDIWNSADGFRFHYGQWQGDGSVVARVAALSNTHPWAKAGVMIRESLAPDAVNAAMLLTADNVCCFQTRPTTGAATELTSGPWLGAPYWVKITRSGSVFSGYISPDGVTWTLVGARTMTMGSNVYVGLAASSHNTSVQTTASFDHVVLPTGAPPAPLNAPTGLSATLSTSIRVQLNWTDNSADETGFVIERSTGDQFQTIDTVAANTPRYLDTTVSANTTYSYRVRAVRDAITSAPSTTVQIITGAPPPAPDLVGSDIGAVGVPGSFTKENGVYTLNGSGADVWGTHDSFYGAARLTNGDFDARARVASLTNTHPWAKAGIMAREGSMDGATNIAVVVTADNVAGVQMRTGPTNETTFFPGPWVAAPYWVRLTRVGSTFTGYISPDGVTWQTIWSGRLIMVQGIGVNLMTTSHDNTRTTTATFTDVLFQ